MADYRLSAQLISRGRGQSAVAAAAYRAGEKLYDERAETVFDYTRKRGVLHQELIGPEGTPDELLKRDRLWNQVEDVERRKDAQLAREVQLSLPHELDLDSQKDLVRGFVCEAFVGRGMIADIALHAPSRGGDERNVHAHVLLTLRAVDGNGFARKKAREWNGPEVLESWRELWARHQNWALERHGIEQRVDHRSFERQGKDREASRHLGPTAARMERAGKRSNIGDENRAIQARNALRHKRQARAKVIGLSVVREKRRFEAWSGAREAELHSQKIAKDIALGRKHGRERDRLDDTVERTYGRHRRQLEARVEKLDVSLENDGLRKVVRNVIGRTKRDERDRSNALKTLASIKQRSQEMAGKLALTQSRERDRAEKANVQRELALERRLTKARERRERSDWKPLPPKPKGSSGGKGPDPQLEERADRARQRDERTPPDPKRGPRKDFER
ncbi:MAG: MobQ family relaxase [Pseudomonadota bacterium]